MTERWFTETLYPGWGQRFRVLREIAHVVSDFQDILVFESASHGRILVLDGVVQVTEVDEFAYQEMIAHVPLIAHGNPRRVLIIGAGDGGVLRRVLQHKSVEHAVMVEIDREVIRLSREFLPQIGGPAWEDERAKIIVGDGIDHVARAQAAAYDVIIVDSTDPAGVGETLFSEQFYADCARVLGHGGVVVNQCGVPSMQAAELTKTSALRALHFAHVTAFLAAVPTYVGGFMALGFASNTPDLAATPARLALERADQAGIRGQTQYWTPELQSASFQLPPYIARCLPDVSGLPEH